MRADTTLDARTREAFLDLVMACAKGCTQPERFRDLMRHYGR